ncbi:DUF58 domain-containing protein [Mechercharimyces sp. CAU 1602]|uniref:DUF58 domain-containing protein n=1 Tax=Mechercharimyces sp. CAU 1602 TaxID=2973933 RepID=UPI002163D0E1|nr:DUF58 domain-containing protein [Mechercharimyces sp. CAU 1602]MCS1351105.1 DUF58 domain-containing protein [Mechercharimyces sp. CAU 1602]
MTSSKKLSMRSRFRDNAYIPTTRLLYLLTGAIVLTLFVAMLWQKGWIVFIFLYSLLLVLVLLDRRSLVKMTEVKARRESRSHFELGLDNPISVYIYNPLDFPVRVQVRDDYPEGFSVDGRNFTLAIPSGEERKITYSARPHRRGEHLFGSIHVRMSGSFGLLERQRAVATEEKKKTYPNLTEVRRVRGGAYQRLLMRSGAHRFRGMGRGMEFSHIREYVPDDEPRSINWSATARTGHLVTNVYQLEQGQHITIVLDCGRMMGVSDAYGTRLDRSLEAALVFAAIALEQGDHVSLLAVSNKEKAWVPMGKGTSHFKRLLEATYSLQPDMVETDYRTALETVARKHQRRMLVAVFTDATQLTFVDELAQAIHMLNRRHLVLTASMEDPLIMQEVTQKAVDEKGVYRQAVALQFLEERMQKLRQLKRRGIITVDVPPTQLSGAVMHQYIAIKNRGML